MVSEGLSVFTLRPATRQNKLLFLPPAGYGEAATEIPGSSQGSLCDHRRRGPCGLHTPGPALPFFGAQGGRQSRNLVVERRLQ